MKNDSEVPQEWLFTFGYNHAHPNKFVRIFGTHSSARDEMVRRHGNKFAFQYQAKEESKLKRYLMTELKE